MRALTRNSRVRSIFTCFTYLKNAGSVTSISDGVNTSRSPVLKSLQLLATWVCYCKVYAVIIKYWFKNLEKNNFSVAPVGLGYFGNMLFSVVHFSIEFQQILR